MNCQDPPANVGRGPGQVILAEVVAREPVAIFIVLVEMACYAPANLDIPRRVFRIDDGERHAGIVLDIPGLAGFIKDGDANILAIPIVPNRAELRFAFGADGCKAADQRLTEQGVERFRNRD